jgi:hypothetical protein
MFEGMTEGLGHDMNATSRPRRVVVAHGKVVVRSWRGTARLGLSLALGCGGARMRVLASQGRGMAVPCVGHRHPGPATRRDGGGRRRLRGALQRDGSLHKKRHGGRMGERGS